MHSNWDISTMQTLLDNRPKVRISGWLLLDPFHPDHITKGIRGTLWEIHPIMEIEVQQNGQWIKLDDWGGQSSLKSLRTAAKAA